MKQAILKVLLVICGLNFFTSCYGMPPGDWDKMPQFPEGQEQTESPIQSAEDTGLEQSERIAEESGETHSHLGLEQTK